MTSAISTISSKKQVLQELAASHMVADFMDYRDKVLVDGDVDDHRKLIEVEMRLTGAEMDKKVDPNAHLTTFNFVFNNGGVHATIETKPADVLEAKPLEVLEDVTPPAPPPQRRYVPEPVTESDLDNMLDDLIGRDD